MLDAPTDLTQRQVFHLRLRHLLHDKLDHVTLHLASGDVIRSIGAKFLHDLRSPLHVAVGFLHLGQDLQQAPNVGFRDVNGHSTSRRPTTGGTLHDSRDEVRAQIVAWHLQTTKRFESRSCNDGRA